MGKRKSTYLVTLVTLLFCGQASAEPELGIGIKTSCQKYGVEDTATLSVAIYNLGHDPVVLYNKLGWGELGGLMLRVSKPNGGEVHQDGLDDDMIVPSTLGERGYYTNVFANQFIGASRTESVRELFSGPGQYKVWAEYVSPVPLKSSLIKEDFWSREKGAIVSRPILITVGEGKSCQP